MTSEYSAPAAPAGAPADRIEIGNRIADLMPRAIDELAELVAIPSIADERIVDPAECVRAAEWVRVKQPQGGPAWVARDLLWGW